MANAYSPERSAEILALLEEGLSYGATAKRLGADPKTLRKRFPGYKQGEPTWDEARTARAKAMIDDGVPYAEIARTMGASVKTLEKKFGPSPYRRGELTAFYNSVRLLEGRGSFNPTFGEFRRD